MCRCILAILLTLLLAPTALAGQATLVRIIDGDSLVIKHNDRDTEIRLIGMDAPEYRQEWGHAAKDYVQSYLHGKSLRVEYGKKRLDRFGRTLAYIFADGELLNETLILHGLAIPYPVPPNTRYKVRFEQAAAKARKARNGFWKQGGLSLTPRQFRRLH